MLDVDAPSLPYDLLLKILGFLPLDARLRADTVLRAMRNHAPHWRRISFLESPFASAYWFQHNSPTYA